MESPGEFLKRERELRGVTIETISLELKLSPKTIKAIEDNNEAELPHSAYVKGFIRSYCHWLGLDDNDAVLRYESYLRERAEIELMGKSSKRSKPSDEGVMGEGVRPKAKAGLQTSIIFAVAGLLIIIGYVVVYGPSRSEMVTLPKAEVVVDVDEDKTLKGEDAEAGLLEVAAPTVVLPELSAEEVSLDNDEDLSGVVDSTNAESATVTETTPLGQEVLTANKKLSLDMYARKLSWVDVSIDGEPPYDITLREGERVSLKAAKVFF